ncbi:putative transcription factor bHLH family [Lupinus albus]|uniref:Putative transcription factor bHLH family n=1 Tax=Lupinus albus TaxID=3870 RepID=A0A6A4Q3N1_LUPAL|nr:putative transcription factor bHLH family [Lupinus albus]
MGCNKGEIELGFSNMSQDEIQTALRSLFPSEFSRQIQPIDPNPPSSSSSSLRSLSKGSPEYSSLIFTTPETLRGIIPTILPPLDNEHQQAIQVTPSHQFHAQDNEQDEIMRTILYILTSSPSSYSSTTSTFHHQNLPYNSAFKRYRPNLGSNIKMSQMGSNFQRQNILNRSFEFFRKLNLSRIREHIQATQTTSTQLHHMISERRRREKLNENFQALRTLLPLGTKKDKASILTSAKETLKSLMAEIEKLSKRNQELVSLLATKECNIEKTKTSFSSNEKWNVQVSYVPQSSSSQERMVDLQVNLRGQVSQVDILIRLLEFLKQVQNVSFISMGATQGNDLHQLTFRLRIIEKSEWDESTFEEAIRRVVTDLLQWQRDK